MGYILTLKMVRILSCSFPQEVYTFIKGIEYPREFRDLYKICVAVNMIYDRIRINTEARTATRIGGEK